MTRRAGSTSLANRSPEPRIGRELRLHDLHRDPSAAGRDPQEHLSHPALPERLEHPVRPGRWSVDHLVGLGLDGPLGLAAAALIGGGGGLFLLAFCWRPPAKAEAS